jgi:hypothetical protein
MISEVFFIQFSNCWKKKFFIKKGKKQKGDLFFTEIARKSS